MNEADGILFIELRVRTYDAFTFLSFHLKDKKRGDCNRELFLSLLGQSDRRRSIDPYRFLWTIEKIEYRMECNTIKDASIMLIAFLSFLSPFDIEFCSDKKKRIQYC